MFNDIWDEINVALKADFWQLGLTFVYIHIHNPHGNVYFIICGGTITFVASLNPIVLLTFSSSHKKV